MRARPSPYSVNRGTRLITASIIMNPPSSPTRSTMSVGPVGWAIASASLGFADAPPPAADVLAPALPPVVSLDAPPGAPHPVTTDAGRRTGTGHPGRTRRPARGGVAKAAVGMAAGPPGGPAG